MRTRTRSFRIGGDDTAKRTSGFAAERVARRNPARRLRRRAGQNLAEVPVDPALGAPVARVAERYFVVPNAMAKERRAQVQVAGDHRARAKSPAPLLGAHRSAPDREARNARRAREVVAKRPVIDE